MSDSPWWPADAPATADERLERLGWDADRQAEFAAAGGSAPGRVARVDRGVCTVFAADGTHRAAVPPRFQTPAAGDWAAFRPAVPGGDDAVLEAESIAFGADVLAVSAETGDGLDRLAPQLAGNRTIALLGLSGAGKSTLVNRLLGEQRLATADVRDDGRGRHTTTHRELIPLPGGGVIIDTPGMRSVGLWDADGGAGLEQTFADLQELAADCRFSDCRHDGEPGCAVTAAVDAGSLPADRLASYNKLLRELRFQELKQDKRARSEERARWRVMNKAMRNRTKP